MVMVPLIEVRNLHKSEFAQRTLIEIEFKLMAVFRTIAATGIPCEFTVATGFQSL